MSVETESHSVREVENEVSQNPGGYQETLLQETWDTFLALFSPEWLPSDPGSC